jgi:electron transport complex protein RnfB
MTEEELDEYRLLQQHLDKMPIGFPPTKSGVELRLLKYLFTPQEAKIATMLKFSWFDKMESLEVIYERIKDTGISIVDLEHILDNMAKKGAIISKKENGEKKYSNALFMVGMYEFQVNRLKKQFFKDSHKYLLEAYAAEFYSTKISQLRTIPIEQSITPEHHVASYNDIVQIIEDTQGPFMVTNCLCRQGMDLIGRPCKMTERRELCIASGNAAQLYIDHGWGRSISKEEVLKIIRKNEEEGLVLQPANAQKPDFICSCCGCCCPHIGGLKKIPRPIDFVSSNYYAEVDPELCTGCGTCVERCQLNALEIINDKSSVNLNKCIGCGNCVQICPSEAIQLIKKEKEIIPPKTLPELFMKIMEKKSKINEK